jgi:phosphoribosylformylglycinamidine synthase subunit PurS
MKFIAEIDVMPQKEILDPQGKAVMLGLKNLGIRNVADVRIGRHITLEMEVANQAAAEEEAAFACQKLLANLIMEDYTFTVRPA